MKQPFWCVCKIHQNSPNNLEIKTLEMKEVAIIIYPKIADDLFTIRKPKSQIIWRIPFKKWYEKPRIAKNMIIFIGKEVIKEINNSK